jgi:para-nitrobenzyl esterase
MISYWTEFAYHGTPGRGRKGDLPEWKPWENNPGGSKFLILDTQSGGGIRMSSDTITAQDIKNRLIRDQSLIGNQKVLCLLYAKLFLYSFQSTHHWNEQEYNTFGKQGCKDYPPAQFR